MIRRSHAFPATAVALAACAAMNAAPAVAQAPSIDIQSRAEQWLLAGSLDDPYWVIDNRWGQGSVPNDAFSQGVGGGSSADGRIAFRMQWRWPQGDTEVKGYPAALNGRKPGYAGYTTSLLQGAGLAPSNASATARLFPLKLPVTPVKAHVAFQHNSPPTGQGHLTFDIWLQSDARQDNGWTASSITHEIMIPLDLWGNYGAHDTRGGRNPGWYDHDATIAGKLYHVYITKDGDGCSRYNFGSLSGAYGKTGWKLIAFVPAQLPVPPGELDLAAIVNHVATRRDACGEPWARGDEYLVSAELGVEPVVGTGDVSVYDYKLSNTGVTATGTTVVVPARPLGGGGYNPGPGGGGGGGGGNSGSGGGGNAGNGGNDGNGGNTGNGGHDGGANTGGGNTGGGTGANDDDANKGKDKYHKFDRDGSRVDKNGNKAKPVTAKPRSESTEGTAPAGSTATPPAAPVSAPVASTPPPAAGATVPPPAGTTVPPAAGSVVPPPTGATVPPPTGATLPPPAGATVPPPAGATLQPAAGTALPPPTAAAPTPATVAPPPAASTPAPPAPPTVNPATVQAQPAAAAVPVPTPAASAPVPAAPPPTARTGAAPAAAAVPATPASAPPAAS